MVTHSRIFFFTDSDVNALPSRMLWESAASLKQVSFYRLTQMVGKFSGDVVVRWKHMNRFEVARCPFMTGTIPTEFGLLTALTGLMLNRNGLSGTLPTQLGLLTKLKQLTLDNQYGASFTGPIPTQIGLLTKLTRLHIWRNAFLSTIPTEIAKLQSVKYLHLYKSNLNGTIPSEIGLMTQLTSLKLDDNRLTGTIPSQLGALTRLENLHLHENTLTSKAIPPQVKSIASLRDIRI